MITTRRPNINQTAVIALIAFGIVMTILSGFYVSSFLAILGVALIFWGAILLYITPNKHVPLTVLNAIYDVSNIERIIVELDLTSKGIYLPPKNLKNKESSLIFIPEKNKTILPKPEEINNKLFTKTKEGIFLTPPGITLCSLLEHELGISFNKLDLSHLQTVLPKLLTEDLELVENIEIKINEDRETVTIKITNSILDQICNETQNQPRTHNQIGCVLSSAIACALAKAIGESVIILKEKRNPETKITQIDYQILNVQPTTTRY